MHTPHKQIGLESVSLLTPRCRLAYRLLSMPGVWHFWNWPDISVRVERRRRGVCRLLDLCLHTLSKGCLIIMIASYPACILTLDVSVSCYVHWLIDYTSTGKWHPPSCIAMECPLFYLLAHQMWQVSAFSETTLPCSGWESQTCRVSSCIT